MKTLLTSVEVFHRQLTLILKGLGFNDLNSQVLAEVSDKTILFRWSSWITGNCVACKYDPSTCQFFNPNRVVGLSVEELVEFNMKRVEENFSAKCPLLSVDTEDKTEPNL